MLVSSLGKERKATNPQDDVQIVATVIFHASTFDFFLAVLGLADSLGSGEPGGSVGGQGALSTSGSGSRGIEGLLETPENNTCEVAQRNNLEVTKYQHKNFEGLLLSSLYTTLSCLSVRI